MNTYTNCLPAWSVGPDCYREVWSVVRRYGKTAAVVGGKTALQKGYGKLPSQSGFFVISKHFTATPRIPPTSSVLKYGSSRCSAMVEPRHFTTRLPYGLRSL